MNEDNDEFNAINAMGAHLVELVEPVTRQDLDNLDNKVNELISSLTQNDKTTARIHKLVEHYFQKMDHINKNQFDVYNQILFDNITRIDNLEMKLRKRGHLSTQHAIDYTPYKVLHNKKGSRPTPPYAGSLVLHGRTRGQPIVPFAPEPPPLRDYQIANKYTVL